jgi:hypothetical protein
MNKWYEYIGSLWFNILRDVPLNKKGIVVEIAPGSVSKIGRGLADYDFKGTLYIVEPNYSSLGEIIIEYCNLLPNANLMPINRTLRAAIPLLPKKPDIILANHPLDDMIIGNVLSIEDFDKFFTNHYNRSSIFETKALWDILKNSPISFNLSLLKVLEDWKSLIKQIRPSNIAISQYYSFFFKQHGLTEPDDNAIKLLRKIETVAQKEGFNIIYPLDLLVDDKNLWSLMKGKNE